MEKKKYEIDFSFFIVSGESDSIERKDALLDALDTIPEIDYYDVYDDGEDWCINCTATVESGACKKIDDALGNKLWSMLKQANAHNETYDYHYMKGLDNDFYWQP